MEVSDEVQLIINQIMKDNIEQCNDYYNNYIVVLTKNSSVTFISLVEKRHIYQYLTDFLLKDTGIIFLSKLDNKTLHKIKLNSIYNFIQKNGIDLYRVYINTIQILNSYLQENNDETN